MKLEVFSKLQFTRLEKIRKNLASRIPFMLEGVGPYMVASVNENFEAQGRPVSWVENAEATLKTKKGRLILHESALLKLGITYRVDESEKEVHIGPSGPALPYSAIHQFGGKAGRNRKVNIPARPYLVFQEPDKEWINRFIRNEVFYGTGK